MASDEDDLVITSGRELQTLDAETAAKSVIVSNIPEGASAQDIIIHFQKRKQGGGDIERLHVLEGSETAVVTFCSDEHARLVLEKTQRLKDCLLELKPYTSFDEKLPEVYCCVSGRIDPEACGISSQVLRKLLQKVEEKMDGIKHEEKSDFFVVSGTFEDVRRYQKLLQDLLVQEGVRPTLKG